MIPAAVIGREHRANLRRLRAEFQLAYDAVENLTDRTSAEFLEADRHYRTWIKAIDGVALALLDDIDGFEAAIEAGELSPADVVRPLHYGVEAEDVSAIFRDLGDFEQTRELVGTSLDIPLRKEFDEDL
jgi:hypothetical protein